MTTRRPLTKVQKTVLAAAFVPMLATGVAGGIGTFSNISRAYGEGTALGAVAAGEGATAVLALVLLGLTMLGQSSPQVIRLGLWALPAAASAMAAMAGDDPGRTVIYAVTPMGMCVSAEGMAFLARRIVVHQDGRDAEAEARAAAVVRELAYHRAVAANHPDEKVRAKSERTSWELARKVGLGDHSLGIRLLEIQRERVTGGADAALAAMFTAPTDLEERPSVDPTATAVLEITTGDANQDESLDSNANRLGSDLEESAPEPVPPVDDEPASESADSEAAARDRVLDGLGLPKESPAAATHRPRRSTGRVPESARTPRAHRSSEQLLSEARELTADWPDAHLSADRIRKAVRTSSANARKLRDALLAERTAPGEDGTAAEAA